MTHAIRIHENGGTEVLRWEAVDVPDPGPGEAVIRQTASGLNFIDVYFRIGLYPAPSFPLTIGNEGVGVVEAVGDGVTEVAVGDRVTYCMSLGSYAQRRIIASRFLVKIPDGISDEQAAAVMLKGCTVQYLVRRTHAVQPGETVLFHAAAGGTGLIALPVAEAPRRHRHRHRRHPREGGAGQGPRLRSSDRLHGRELRRPREGADRRQGRSGGLRFGGQGHVRRLAALPAAARADGELRQRVGRRRAVQAGAAGPEGIAVPHASDLGELHGDAAGARGNDG